MKYGKIFYCDIANGSGVRTALFVSGCRHHCKGCFNPETWDFNYGEEYTQKTEDEIIDSLKTDYVVGLSLLGGEPMEPENQPYVRRLCQRAKREFPDKTIWMYSGYTLEEMLDESNIRCHTSDTADILACLDVLVDGEFVLEKKNISLRFRGSENQRIIDVPKSLSSGDIVLTDYMTPVRGETHAR
ncbi:MAG: anaerobic ribonucleoside-triphosphate reductase activating protein [Eubacterium sp.]|nr:anaerobic ribonucleoside-triphosphate reductase activating protein [Eubacterium sp.]